MITIPLEDKILQFSPTKIIFHQREIVDVFSHKNNRTLRETFSCKRYKSLANDLSELYKSDLDTPLGEFLLALKASRNAHYLRFLNSYGDKTYCHFELSDDSDKQQKGIYIYMKQAEIVYIGRCLDSFGKRVNQGYGKIHPKNCYIDGQSTNCHLNSLIHDTESADEISFHIHPLNDNTMIKDIEEKLIRQHAPRWNIALKPTHKP